MTEATTGKKTRLTYSILERTDPAEWSALDNATKQIYSLIISAGLINFQEGSNVRSMLLAIFPVGSITGDKLRTM